MYTSARCVAGHHFSMPSNPTQSVCWLQALHGNEAKVVDLLRPNLSAGHKTPSCLRTGWDTLWNILLLHSLEWQRRVGNICLQIGFAIIWTESCYSGASWFIGKPLTLPIRAYLHDLLMTHRDKDFWPRQHPKSFNTGQPMAQAQQPTK